MPLAFLLYGGIVRNRLREQGTMKCRSIILITKLLLCRAMRKSLGMKGASCVYDKVSGIHSGNFPLFSHGVFD